MQRANVVVALLAAAACATGCGAPPSATPTGDVGLAQLSGFLGTPLPSKGTLELSFTQEEPRGASSEAGGPIQVTMWLDYEEAVVKRLVTRSTVNGAIHALTTWAEGDPKQVIRQAPTCELSAAPIDSPLRLEDLLTEVAGPLQAGTSQLAGGIESTSTGGTLPERRVEQRSLPDRNLIYVTRDYSARIGQPVDIKTLGTCKATESLAPSDGASDGTRSEPFQPAS